MKKKGGLKNRLEFCKSLKTNVEKMSVFRLSMMLMKTRELNRSLHYVDENKGDKRIRPSAHRIIGPSKTNLAISRWIDEPMNRWHDISRIDGTDGTDTVSNSEQTCRTSFAIIRCAFPERAPIPSAPAPGRTFLEE